MKRTLSRIAVALALGTAFLSLGWAGSAGDTLTESASARAAGLSDALTAADGELDALGSNPAGLAGLQGTHLTFQYHRGLADDAFGSLQIGRAFGGMTLGLSAGAFDAGEVVLFDGATDRTVAAQRDWSAALAAAGRFGRISAGLTAKYLSSNIAEEASASAVAGDAGLLVSFGRFSIGAAAQNIGADMTYIDRAHPLPRLARAGLAYRFGKDGKGAGLYADGRYRFEEADFIPAAGFEVGLHPLTLRAGYQASERLDAFTAGAGVQFGPMRLDYAFGMASQFDDRHRVSLAMAFGAPRR